MIKIYDPKEIAGTTEFGGLVKPAFARDNNNEMSCGVFILKPGESLKDYESHASDEIFYIASGSLTVLSKDSGAVTVQKGQIARIPKTIVHLSKNEGDTETVVFWCNRD